MTRAAFAVLALALAFPAAAKDIRVAADGSGDYRGVAKALEKAAPGDVIVIKKPVGMVGAILKADKGAIVLEGTLPGSPAEAAGLKKGERLAAVDGVDVSSKPLAEVVGLVRGPVGSTVTLTMSGGREAAVRRGETRIEVKDDLSKARIAYGEEDFQTAVAYAKKPAEAGVAAAQLLLAIVYTQGGEGVRRDGVAAFGWAAMAAKAGDAGAQRLLADMYRHGTGGHKDEHLAKYWQEKAEEKRPGGSE